MPGEKRMTDERLTELRALAEAWGVACPGVVHGNDAGDVLGEALGEIDALRAELATALVLAKDTGLDLAVFRERDKLRVRCRRQRVELERLNIHLAAARWGLVNRHGREQLSLDLAELRATNTKLRADRNEGRRWVAVGSMREVQEMNRLEAEVTRLRAELAAMKCRECGTMVRKP